MGFPYGRRRIHRPERIEARCLLSTVGFDSHIVNGDPDDGPLWVQVAVLDGDRDDDLIVASERSFAWYRNLDGRGAFSGPISVLSPDRSENLFSSSNGHEAAVADLDGDGDLDLLSTAGGSVAWHENANHRGQFRVAQDIVVAQDEWDDHLLRGVVTVDLDRDGDQDVLTHALDGDQHKLLWSENLDGRATFAAARSLATESHVFAIEVTDFDGDRRQDILVGSYQDGVIWYEYASRPARMIRRRVVWPQADMIHTADIDGDGDDDLLTGRTGLDQSIVWHENTRGRLAPPRPIVEAGFGLFEAVVSGDVDGDGDMDVLSADYHNTIAWHENLDGQGAFGPTRNVARRDALGTRAIDVTDIDGDGDLDVISAGYYFEFLDNDLGVAWHENRLIGDTNRDGAFNADDLILAFASGKYDDEELDNATFNEGDWNQDGDFDSDDLLLAFSGGHYDAALEPLALYLRSDVDK